jgi:hypothetical protein
MRRGRAPLAAGWTAATPLLTNLLKSTMLKATQWVFFCFGIYAD